MNLFVTNNTDNNMSTIKSDNDDLCSFVQSQIEKNAATSRFETTLPIVTMEPTTTMPATQDDGIADLYHEVVIVTPTTTTKISEVKILVDSDGSTNCDFDDIVMEAIEVLLHNNVDTTAEPIHMVKSKIMVDDDNQLDLVATFNLYVHSTTFNLHSDDRLKICQIEQLNKRGMIANTPRNKRILECIRLGQPTQKHVASKQAGAGAGAADTLDIIVNKGFTISNLFTLHKDNKLKLCQIERLQKHGLVANTRHNQQTLGRIGRATQPNLTSPRRRRRRTSSLAIREKNLKLIVPSINLDDDVNAKESSIDTTVTSNGDAATNDPHRVSLNDEEKPKCHSSEPDDCLGLADVDDFCCESGEFNDDIADLFDDEPVLLEEAA
jgi:hypothetical protein